MPPLRGRSGVEPSDLQNRVDHWQRFKTGDFAQKWNSSKLIVKEGKNAIAPLLDLLNDPTVDSETHWFTIRALGNFPEPGVIEAIAAQIGNTAHYTSRTSEQADELSDFAIETLAAMGNVAIDILSQLLHQPQRRLLAAKALNQVRSSGVIPAMLPMAKDDNAQVRYYAIDALGSFHNEAVTDALLSALQDPASKVRKAAVMALGRRRDLQAHHQLSQQLQPLLWDITLEVSCQAALALGRLGAEDAIEALQQVLLSDHTPMTLRIDTVRALEWYCNSSDPTHQAVVNQAFTVLIDALEQFGRSSESNSENNIENHLLPLPPQEKQQMQVAIIRVLGDLRYGAIAQEATEILIKRLENYPPAAVAQAIIMALANLGQPQAFDALLPLLNHPADVVPIHTIAALKRLDPDHSLKRVTNYINHFPESQTDVLDFW
ncbi:MAG: HEAT repeat domain-containing protein [Cyanobacteria bacterium P01_F01_bin.13]